MNLRDKLERLGVHKGIHHLRPPEPPTHKPGLERIAPGQAVANDWGEFFLIEESFPLQFRHGQWALGALLEHTGSDIQPLARDASLDGFDFRQAVFLDTETTGLAGGTGTYAFLVGIGFLDGDQFRLQQFFMRDLSEEPAMLAGLAQVLGRHRSLVTFNGRAFDWPLLETRFVMTRRPSPLIDPPHIDLLHLARRLWRTRLDSCALSSLEKNVLGVERANEDVPGWMVPQIYFQYLQDGDARPLKQVLYHNSQDILSLVTLSAYLAQIGRDPFEGCLVHGEDFYSLGRFLESSGDLQGAMDAYQHALSCPLHAKVRHNDVMRLSLLHKRLGNREQAVELWRSALGTGHLDPYVELAKHYEHQDKDYEKALACVRDALALVESTRYTEKWRKQRDLEDLGHRLTRLNTKLARQSSEKVAAPAADPSGNEGA